MAAICALKSKRDCEGAGFVAGLPRRVRMAVKEKPLVKQGAMAKMNMKSMVKILEANMAECVVCLRMAFKKLDCCFYEQDLVLFFALVFGEMRGCLVNQSQLCSSPRLPYTSRNQHD